MGTPQPEPLEIAGALLLRLVENADERGSLTETYQRGWLPNGGEVVQSNLSRSRPGVLRGLHWHREQSDYWCVLEGVAHVVLVDLRDGSPSQRLVAEIRVAPAEGHVGIWLPPGIAHGFYAETPVTLQYLVDRPYTGEDEFGLAWDDADLAIAWPHPEPILSERDRSNPSLREVLTDPPPMSA